MNRQEVVITIAKLNRVIKQLYYWVDLDSDFTIDAFDDDFSELVEGSKNVHVFLKKNPIRILAEQILKIGTMDSIEKYINERNCTIDARIRPYMIALVKSMNELQDLSRKILAKKDSKYPGLVRALANKQAVQLLQRAVDAKLLRKDFMPEEETTNTQLRVIAFAVGTLLNLPRTQIYVHFEKQWQRPSYRLSTNPLPRKYGCEKHLFAMSLYPEVDFTAMSLPCKEIDTFYTDRNEGKIKRLYDDLVSAGYIGTYSTFEEFEGIFNSEKYIRPVDWIQEQRFLGYFVNIAFSRLNPRNLWNKTVSCFTVYGVEPHKGSLCSGITYIKRKGLMDTYNKGLKEIVDRFNDD